MNIEEISSHWINIEETRSHCIDIEETSHYISKEETSSHYINKEETSSHYINMLLWLGDSQTDERLDDMLLSNRPVSFLIPSTWSIILVKRSLCAGSFMACRSLIGPTREPASRPARWYTWHSTSCCCTWGSRAGSHRRRWREGLGFLSTGGNIANTLRPSPA